jgi:hypothetical protein
MTTYSFAGPRLSELDGFHVEIDEARKRADIILNRPPFNIVSMPHAVVCACRPPALNPIRFRFSV